MPAAKLPEKLVMTQRVFYEIGTSGVYRDLQPGDVVTDPEIIQEVIDRNGGFY